MNLALTYTMDALRNVSDDLLALEAEEKRIQARRARAEARCSELVAQLEFLKSLA